MLHMLIVKDILSVGRDARRYCSDFLMLMLSSFELLVCK